MEAIMKKIYELKQIHKIYKMYDTENHALNDISLTLNEGEIIAILGPSGSGKSTMLNVLSGIDNPSRGEVLFKGQDIAHFKEEDLTIYRRENLGFIFQSYNLVSNLTIKENIELGAHLSKDPLNIDTLLSIVGLTDHKKKYPYQLSGGQMQRVAIARALAKNPKVLFCDEPTGALDETTGKKVLATLQEINEKYGTTMIIVTHNPSIADMAHTVIKMNSGIIKEMYTNEEVLRAEDLRWA